MEKSIPSSLIILTSSFSAKEAIERITKILKEKNVMIFARISHSDAAKQAGLQMQDEELIIFGNPKVGTALMLENPAIGVELPLKIIAWRNAHNKTHVAYPSVERLGQEYGIQQNKEVCAKLEKFMQELLANALAATSK